MSLNINVSSLNSVLGNTNATPGNENSNIFRTSSAVYAGQWINSLREAVAGQNKGVDKNEPEINNQLNVPSSFIDGNF